MKIKTKTLSKEEIEHFEKQLSRPPIKVKVVDKIQQVLPREINLKMVVSSGNVGPDIAALQAAKEHRIRTGGHLPQGYVTDAGRKPGYKWMYKCVDDILPMKVGSYEYTNIVAVKWKNVEVTDATLRLGTSFKELPERSTLEAVQFYKKPILDVWMKDSKWSNKEDEVFYALDEYDVATWILVNGITTLNVTGNACTQLQPLAYDFLLNVFNILLWQS